MHASNGIRIHDPSVRAGEDGSCLRHAATVICKFSILGTTKLSKEQYEGRNIYRASNACPVKPPNIVRVFRTDRSQQNAQWIWSSPLTEIRIAGCVGVTAEPVTLPASQNAYATTTTPRFTMLVITYPYAQPARIQPAISINSTDILTAIPLS
jgi:hypothetical protein